MITTSVRAARATEKVQHVNGKEYLSRGYVGEQPDTKSKDYGSGAPPGAEPQGFLITQPPNSTTRPHFHQTNQFQAFVAGSGTVGRSRADPVTVQFAGPDTTYGPIVAEGEGISYFTLRQSWDPGAQYMPESRAKLQKGAKRQIVARRGEGEVTEAGGVRTETLIAEGEDGLSAFVLTLPPGQETRLADAGIGGGQYQVVLSGTQIREGEALEPLSVEFAFPGDGRVPVRAGEDGLELLVMRFPREG